jgi:glyoxylase I family protein
MWHAIPFDVSCDNPMVATLSHVGISVRDLERSIAFFGAVLGTVVKVSGKFEGPRYDKILGLPRAHGRAVMLATEHLELELFEFYSPVPRSPSRVVADYGISHFCVEVSDIEHVCRRVVEAGGLLHCDPIDFAGLGRATYALDIDGNVFELVERPSAASAT